MSLEKIKTVTLADVSINNKGEYGIGASAVDYSDELYTYLRITDINDDGTLNKNDLKSVDDVDAKNYLLNENDVVFARTGNSTGKAYYYDKMDGELVYAGFLIKFSLDSSKINPKFMKYYVLSKDYKGWVNSMCTGSTRPNINAKMYGNMELILPPREQQDFLVNILGEIDNKIEINKMINKNLEELMHVLFKKYFIDNNPFYVENDEKWNIIKLKDLIIRNRDKINDFDNWKDELLIDLSNMPRFSIAISNFDKGKKFTSNIYKLNKYDLLFGSIRPYFGKVGFSPINGVVTGTVHSFKPIDDIYYSLVLSLISSKTFINYTVSVSKGTKMPSVKWDDFINYEFAIPDDLSKIGEYNKILLPLIHKIEKNILEIQRLTKLRDTLLPKLMSGEIDVSKINCDLKIIIRKIYIKSSKLFLWRYLSENKNYIKNTKSNETLLKSRTIYKINKFLAKFNARYRYYRQ